MRKIKEKYDNITNKEISRKDFLKKAGLLGIGLLGIPLLSESVFAKTLFRDDDGSLTSLTDLKNKNHSALTQLDYASAGHTGFQPTLVSTTNIKSINGASILGAGDLTVTGSSQWTTTGSDIYYNGGNVGIGTTTPVYNLEVSGAATYMGIRMDAAKSDNTGQAAFVFSKKQINKWQFGMDFAANGTADWYVYDQANMKAKIYLNAGTMFLGANAFTYPGMTILDNGNVGIGTTSPSAPLEINVSATKNILFGRDASFPTYGAISMNGSLSDTGMSGFFSGGDNNFYFNTPDRIILRSGGDGVNTKFVFGTNGSLGIGYGNSNADPMTSAGLAINGNVGIGTTGPTAKLHLAAGTATASTAPLKFNAGTLLTTPEIGTLEFTDDGTTAHIYGTVRIAGVVTRVLII